MGLSRFPGLQSLGFLCLVTLMTGFAADATMTTTFFRMFFNWGAAEGRSKVSTPALHVDSLMAPDEEGLR
jgi:hypothetical protein